MSFFSNRILKCILTYWSISIYFYLTCGSINTYLRIRSSCLSNSYHVCIKACTISKLIVSKYIEIISAIFDKSSCRGTFYLISREVIFFSGNSISLYLYRNSGCLTGLRCCIITYLVGYVIITWFHSCRYFHFTCSVIKLWDRISCYWWRSWISYSNCNLVRPCSYGWFCTVKFCTVEYITYFLRVSVISRRCYRIRYNCCMVKFYLVSYHYLHFYFIRSRCLSLFSNLILDSMGTCWGIGRYFHTTICLYSYLRFSGMCLSNGYHIGIKTCT